MRLLHPLPPTLPLQNHCRSFITTTTTITANFSCCQHQKGTTIKATKHAMVKNLTPEQIVATSTITTSSMSKPPCLLQIFQLKNEKEIILINNILISKEYVLPKVLSFCLEERYQMPNTAKFYLMQQEIYLIVTQKKNTNLVNRTSSYSTICCVSFITEVCNVSV